MFQFNKKYLLFTTILFITEMLIGVYVRDSFIRPFGGDFLVVILIYCFVKSFFKLPVLQTAIGVLLFSYIVEALQYIKIVNVLGLKRYALARIIIGTAFSWIDIVCYTAGIAVVLLIEYAYNRHQSKKGVFLQKNT